MCMNYRQKQYSAFWNKISDSTKIYGCTCSWQMRASKRKDISFLKSWYSLVAHGLAELHISNRSKNGSKAGRSRHCLWYSGRSSHSGLGKKSSDVLCGGG